MESLNNPYSDQQLYNLGKEFAFEGMERELFNAADEHEWIVFNSGYNDALALVTKSMVEQPETEELIVKM